MYNADCQEVCSMDRSTIIVKFDVYIVMFI